MRGAFSLAITPRKAQATTQAEQTTLFQRGAGLAATMV